jgi:regulator of PEP synthase PpsR (kinase-PPPase family)
MGVRGSSDYSDPGRIREELETASRLYRDLGCEVIDVTDRAVEETAAVVLELVRISRTSIR